MGSKGDGISLRSDETFGPQESFPSVRSTAYEPPISAELPMGKKIVDCENAFLGRERG